MKVVVIGSGPGGKDAALRAAELGAEVLIIEKDKLGGVCLNEGCIPTKKLLDSAKTKASWQHALSEKEALIENIQEDLRRSLMMSKIEIISGRAEFAGPRTLKIEGDNSKFQIIKPEKIIIATGSLPAKSRFLDYGQAGVLTSKEALNLEKIPETLIIIGGGVIGLEFATIFRSFGTRVTIVEMTETLLPGEDKRIADAINFALRKQGIEILTQTTCQEVISYSTQNQKLLLSNGETIEAEKILVATGRFPNSKDLKLEEAGIKIDQKGFILVNKKMETDVHGIYAVGDVVGRFFLAHVASQEGEVAAGNAMGRHSKMDYSAIPRCIYTSPEIASVGLNAKKAEKLGFEVKTARANFSNNALAAIKKRTFGFCQFVVEIPSQKILGAQIIGERAAELIHEISIAMRAKMTINDLGGNVFAHPTFSEIIKEVARK